MRQRMRAWLREKSHGCPHARVTFHDRRARKLPVEACEVRSRSFLRLRLGLVCAEVPPDAILFRLRKGQSW